MIRQTAIAILVMVSCGWAQPAGHILGTVNCDDGNPMMGATVRMDCYLPSFHASAVTGADGSFEWTNLEDGVYYLTAMCMTHGFAFDSRAVDESDTVSVTLTLAAPVGDDLTQSYAHGTTVIEPPDAGHALPWYFVDVDGDQTGDYRLCFGPPWYDPPAVDRPLNGTEIAVTGGLFSYAEQPMLIVYDLGEAIWRDPNTGHGGFGGTQGFLSLMCHTLDTSGTAGLENLQRIELKGIAMFDLCGPDTTTPYGVFDFSTDEDEYIIDYHLNFGMDRTIPFDTWDSLFVVGGLADAGEDHIPWVIVYECNGQFWREPGDTTGLAPMGGNASEDPFISHPSSFALSAYPNPFNATTTLSFSLSRAEDVSLKLYDVLGQEVETIATGRFTAGDHIVRYSAEHLSSGIYLARLEASTHSVTQKLVILK